MNQNLYKYSPILDAYPEVCEDVIAGLPTLKVRLEPRGRPRFDCPLPATRVRFNDPYGGVNVTKILFKKNELS